MGIILGEFTLGSNHEETQKLTSIGREQNLGPKEFRVGFGSKVWKNEATLMMHFFPTKSYRSLLKIKSILEKPIFKLGSNVEFECKVRNF